MQQQLKVSRTSSNFCLLWMMGRKKKIQAWNINLPDSANEHYTHTRKDFQRKEELSHAEEKRGALLTKDWGSREMGGVL